MPSGLILIIAPLARPARLGRRRGPPAPVVTQSKGPESSQKNYAFPASSGSYLPDPPVCGPATAPSRNRRLPDNRVPSASVGKFTDTLGISRGICSGDLKFDQASQRITGESSEETTLSSFQHLCLAQQTKHQAPGGRWSLRQPGSRQGRTFAFDPFDRKPWRDIADTPEFRL